MTAEAQQRRDEVRRAIHTHLCQAVIRSSPPGSPSDMVEVIMGIIAPDLAEADSLRRQLEEAKAEKQGELAQLRAEIALRAAVVTATRPMWAETANGDRYVDTGDIEEHERSAALLRDLLAQERELVKGN